MKYLFSNKGYSLLLTIGVIIIVSVIGLGLLTLSTSGIAKNQNREDVSQSTDLSEKGVQFMINTINDDLNTNKATVKARTKTVDDVFNNYLSLYSCTKNVEIEGSTGNTEVCIESIEAGKTANTRIVTFKSVGVAEGGHKSTYRAQVELGFSDFPGQLSYAVSSNNKGDVYLFGGTEVRGNVKVEGQLYTSKYAFKTQNDSAQWRTSVYPKLIGTDSNQPATIFTNNQTVKTFDSIPTLKNLITKNNTVNSQINSQGSILKANELNKGFIGTVPIFKPATEEIKPIDIKSKFTEMDALSSKNKVKTDSFTYTYAGSYKAPDNKVVHITKNMRIGKYSNTTDNSVSDDSANYSSFNLSGNYYVDGDVYIKGANLFADAVIYAKGNVYIQNSTVSPLNNGTLFVFADKNVQINNISVDSNPGAGSIINGYFYSNSNFLMYGVGSNTTITGGISSENITLTALRGNSEGKGTNTSYRVNETYEELACYKNAVTSTTPSISSIDLQLTIDWLTNLQNRITRNTSLFGSGDITINRQKYDFANSITFGSGYSSETINISSMKSLISRINSSPTIPTIKVAGYDDYGKQAYIFTNNKWSNSATNVTYRHIQNADLIYYGDTSYNDTIELFLKYWNNSTFKNFAKSFNYYKNVGNSYSLYTADYTNNWDKIKAVLQNSLIENYYSVNQSCINELKEHRKIIKGKVISGSEPADSEENQLNNPSRLTIIYDKELISRFRETTADDASSVKEFTVMKAVIQSLKPIN